MSLLHTLTHPKRIQDVRFHKAKSGEEFLLVAAEDKKVTIYSTRSEDSTSLPVVAEATGHENRYGMLVSHLLSPCQRLLVPFCFSSVKAIDTLAVTASKSDPKRAWTTIMSKGTQLIQKVYNQNP